MLTKNIYFKSFKNKKIKKKIIKSFKNLINEKNEIFKSLGKDYRDSFKKKRLLRLKSFSTIRIIGMGGSILGAKCIYNFLKKKNKKKIYF